MPTRMLRDWTDSDSMDGVSAEAERMFARLIMKADDYGRFHAEPRRLKASLFPLSDTITAAECCRWIKEISKRGLVMLYEAEGKQLLVIRKFGQRMRNSVPKFPPPSGMSGDWRPDDSKTHTVDSNQQQSAAGCGELPQVAASCGELRPEAEAETEAETRGGDGGGDGGVNIARTRVTSPQSSVMDPPSIAAILDNQQFKAIHDAYPPRRRVAARVAAQAFAGLDPPAVLPDVLAGLLLLKQSGDWTRERGRFVPGMVKWIEARGWEGETQCKPQRRGWKTNA